MAKIAEPSAGMSLRLILTLESASDMMTNFSAIMPLRLLRIRRRISRGHGLELVFENTKHAGAVMSLTMRPIRRRDFQLSCL